MGVRRILCQLVYYIGSAEGHEYPDLHRLSYNYYQEY